MVYSLHFSIFYVHVQGHWHSLESSKSWFIRVFMCPPPEWPYLRTENDFCNRSGLLRCTREIMVWLRCFKHLKKILTFFFLKDLKWTFIHATWVENSKLVAKSSFGIDSLCAYFWYSSINAPLLHHISLYYAQISFLSKDCSVYSCLWKANVHKDEWKSTKMATYVDGSLKANMFSFFHKSPLDSRLLSSRVRGGCYIKQPAYVASTECQDDVTKA